MTVSNIILLRRAARGKSKPTPYRIVCDGGADIVVGPDNFEQRFTGRNRMARAVEFAAAAIVGFEAGQKSARRRR